MSGCENWLAVSEEWEVNSEDNKVRSIEFGIVFSMKFDAVHDRWVIDMPPGGFRAEHRGGLSAIDFMALSREAELEFRTHMKQSRGCGCQSGFFGSLPEVPVWSESSDGKLVCHDAKTGNLLASNDKKILPDGSVMTIFQRYPATLKKDVLLDDETGEFVAAGSKVWVEMSPAGEIYIHEDKNSVLVIKTGALEGVDFVFDIQRRSLESDVSP